MVQENNLDKVLITELGAVNRLGNKNAILDYYLNIGNHESINYFSNYGCYRNILCY